jgi:hypothetical protein
VLVYAITGVGFAGERGIGRVSHKHIIPEAAHVNVSADRRSR